MSDSSRLEGRGTLIHAGDEWVDALSRLARLGKLHENPQDNAGCFVARNFALDEGVLDERAASYREAGGVGAHAWEDVKDLFAAGDQEGWADTLRDRLGLAHLDPETRRASIDVLVFRYPVRDVPRILGTGGKKRPLVTPTVLDGPFSEAFCPSPRGGTTGHVVHLAPAAGILRREVLHPRNVFRASHLWRLGKLTRGVDAASLPDQRAVHLLLVRDGTGRDDYARGTDWDLIQ